MGTQELLGAGLSWGKECLFFCLLKCWKVLPIEKYWDHDMRLQIMRSAIKYTLDDVQRATRLGVESAELNAYLLGMARSTEQKLCYALYCIKPLQRTGASQAWAASCCRRAEALGVGWASRTQGVHGHVSCFLPICGQEYVF